MLLYCVRCELCVGLWGGAVNGSAVSVSVSCVFGSSVGCVSGCSLYVF